MLLGKALWAGAPSNRSGSVHFTCQAPERGDTRLVASANMELVRSLYAAWERGDYSSAEWAHPEIEWVIADGPDPGMWTGIAGMAEGFRSSMGVWRDVRAEVEEYREIDDERVLVLEWRRARGKA